MRARPLLQALLWCLLALAMPVAGDDTARLDRELAAASTRLDELLLKFTERHPDVVIARGKLQELRARRATMAAAGTTAPVAGNPSTAAVPPKAETLPVPSSKLVAGARVSKGFMREGRRVDDVESFAALCGVHGVIACFDFDGDAPLASAVGGYVGSLRASGDGKVRGRLFEGEAARGERSVRLDFLPADGADHGAFSFSAEEFGEGDRLTVQWRQWFSPELVVAFDEDNRRIAPGVGGDGAKQFGLSEVGDPRGCSFGEVVLGNPYWRGIVALYHGCGLWYTPSTPAPAGEQDSSDFDLQPGGDNVCRYRYLSHPSWLPDVDYIYPTTPPDLRDEAAYATDAKPLLYHGCIGWAAEQWMTFRLEIDIAFCREPWNAGGIPPGCRDTTGRVRYWVKYADEDQPWLVLDYPMPLRWNDGHSGRYGRFTFLPYNTSEQPLPSKPPAFTLYDDILVAKNAFALPWERD